MDLLPDQKLPWITARWRGTIRALRASSRLSILDSSTSCPPMSCMPVTSNRAVFNYNPSVSHRTGQIWGSFNFAPHILYSAGLSKAFPLRKPKLGSFTSCRNFGRGDHVTDGRARLMLAQTKSSPGDHKPGSRLHPDAETDSW